MTRYRLPVLAVLAAVAIVITGCKKEETSTGTDTSTNGSVLSAPTDYLKQVTGAEKTAVKAVDTATLKNAIDMFNAQEGRLPKDLNELVTKKYIVKIPTPPHGTKIVYNPTSGSVSVEKE